MPPAKLKATAVVAKAPPTATIQPVRASVRRRRERAATPRPPARAAPRSQPAWPPRASFRSRNGPVAPPKVPLVPRDPGPPVWPSSRPKPLYSQIRDQIELSEVPEIQGRLEAGVSQTRTGQASATATRAAPARTSCLTAAPRPRGAT